MNKILLIASVTLVMGAAACALVAGAMAQSTPSDDDSAPFRCEEDPECQRHLTGPRPRYMPGPKKNEYFPPYLRPNPFVDSRLPINDEAVLD